MIDRLKHFVGMVAVTILLAIVLLPFVLGVVSATSMDNPSIPTISDTEKDGSESSEEDGGPAEGKAYPVSEWEEVEPDTESIERQTVHTVELAEEATLDLECWKSNVRESEWCRIDLWLEPGSDYIVVSVPENREDFYTATTTVSDENRHWIDGTFRLHEGLGYMYTDNEITIYEYKSDHKLDEIGAWDIQTNGDVEKTGLHAVQED